MLETHVIRLFLLLIFVIQADQILRDAGIFDVSAGTANNQEPMDTAYQSPLDSPAMRYASLTKRGLRAKIVSSSTKAEWPDPILELDRVIGFSNDYSRMLLWLPDGSACVYTSSSAIIIREFCDEGMDPRRSATSQRVSTEAVKGSLKLPVQLPRLGSTSYTGIQRPSVL